MKGPKVPSDCMRTQMAVYTPRGRESVILRVLEIPEILDLIFSSLERRWNAVNALVCKTWTEPALNNMWRDVTDPRLLFRLLAPMKLSTQHSDGSKSEYNFTRALQPGDWERFQKYARRVRSLHVVEGDSMHLLSSGVFDEIARTRVSLNILPNLRGLTWLATHVERMRFSIMFMHDNISRFAVNLQSSPNYKLSAYFKEIQVRMPNLKHLDLRFQFSVHYIEGDLVHLFRNLPKLKRLILPSYTLTTHIVEELSELHELEVLQFDFMVPGGQGQGAPEDVIDFSPKLREGAFPALFDLSLSCHLTDYTRFLAGSYRPVNLTVLYAHVCWGAKPQLVNGFLEAVSLACPNLARFYIDFFGSPIPEPHEVKSDPPDTRTRVTWNDLRSLLDCKKLVAFELRWDKPLAISEDDLEELASNWPTLEVLLLDCEPMDVSIAPSITLRALLSFAKYCPNLVELGLYMSPCDDLDSATLEMNVPQFKSLKRLAVGLSPIREAGPVALFLSQICPQGCEVDAGMTWPDGFAVIDSPELQRRSTEWHETWQEVNNVLPLVTKLRMVEQANRRMLGDEVEDLRVRNQILQETPKSGIHPDSKCVLM